EAIPALLIAVAAVFLARYVRSRLARSCARSRLDPNVAAMARTGATVGIYAVAAVLIVSLLGGNWTAFVAAFSASAVVLTLALQDILRNVVTGVYLLIERPFAIGDRIEVGNAEGRVQGIEFRTTELLTDAGDRVLVPNATVFAAVVTNRGRRNEAAVTISVDKVAGSPEALDSTLDEVRTAASGILAGAPKIALRSASPDGFAFDLTLPLRASGDPTPVVALLHDRFPDATITLARQ
ncbi:MAG TPA: mechanosensitive ion channel domain-containing protein, partial [Thermomicrobiales bacterium]|nr:mechanosensitive ion channel domain-containing protein [Thermomicrobiales bacterium]